MMEKYKNIIYAISFLDLFAVGLIVPLFQNHLKSLGASHFVIGLLSSTYSGFQFISGPLIGSWSDVGDRKFVLTISLVACCISYFTLSIVSSISAIFIVRIVLGCVKHTQGQCRSMVLNIFPNERHAEILSRTAVLSTISFNLGPLIGGYISELQNGFKYVCWLSSLIFLINIFLSSILPNVSSRSSHNSRNSSWRIREEFRKIGSNIRAVSWAESWKEFLVRFLFGISVAFYYHHEATYLKEEFKLTQKNIGIIISCQGVLQTISVFSSGYIKNYFYKNETSCSKRLFHSFLIMSISIISLWFVNDLTVFILFAIPFRIFSSILRITTMELLLEKCGKEQIGTFNGVSNSVMSVARFIAPVTSGIVIEIFSNRAIFILAFLPSLINTFLVFRSIEKQPKLKKIN